MWAIFQRKHIQNMPRTKPHESTSNRSSILRMSSAATSQQWCMQWMRPAGTSLTHLRTTVSGRIRFSSCPRTMVVRKPAGSPPVPVVPFQPNLSADVVVLGPTNKRASNWPLKGGKGSLWQGGVRGIGFIAGGDLASFGFMGLPRVSHSLIHICGYTLLLPLSLSTRSSAAYWSILSVLCACGCVAKPIGTQHSAILLEDARCHQLSH